MQVKMLVCVFLPANSFVQTPSLADQPNLTILSPNEEKKMKESRRRRRRRRRRS